jgi:hypothetical protein
MGSADDPLNQELLPILPPFFAQKATEDFVITLIAFIESLVTIVEINTRRGI